ncbi:Gfo/Idh/MocA family oxidoreductase [Pelagicoccus sp. SDUM812002]|uniref:Gfo/Idh/MocA family protein n=1 Tax=Pelagicoccus sp. SDUM812002 TaxID=3041266 RepID=UPI00280CBBAE|nr:Gfo/Idh/MocA family oxidoreductase [Pelagicoccus sp. SDUM812002]MDQ8186457.1 Gfo/Idh/MocA family oxidoreductase [Pelagicoccus sp. SDUM812002]
MSEVIKIGVIGCGNISPQYFKGANLYSEIEIAACADLNLDFAKARAEEFGIPQALSVDELLADPELDIVLNLTTPQFHAPLNLRILEAGKHAYCEKPFATNREEGKQVLELATAKGLRVGCAPDTFLSSPLQTARKLVDEGFIGKVFGGTAVFACAGHERWHPNPEFYYKLGGGPVLDMAPYYFTALANLMGPVVSVVSSGKQVFAERTVGSGPLEGSQIAVETLTHNVSILEFANGATVSALFSFDVQGEHDLPMLTLYGTEGNLSLPDPNRFDGDLRVCRSSGSWESLSLQHNYEGARALGLADMAAAIRSERPHRANGEMAFHVFDVMLACEESAASGQRVQVKSRFERLPVIGASEGGSPRF